MANLITFNAVLSAVVLGAQVSATASGQSNMAGNGMLEGTQLIPTNEATVNVGSHTGGGFIFIKNVDPTNFVEVDVATNIAVWPQKLFPNDFIILKPETSVLYARANVASVEILVLALDL